MSFEFRVRGSQDGGEVPLRVVWLAPARHRVELALSQPLKGFRRRTLAIPVGSREAISGAVPALTKVQLPSCCF